MKDVPIVDESQSIRTSNDSTYREHRKKRKTYDEFGRLLDEENSGTHLDVYG